MWPVARLSRCFPRTQDTTLADLLRLNLHCFEEEVRGIVDKAVKEMGMEKVLSELNSTWTGERNRAPAFCRRGFRIL